MPLIPNLFSFIAVAEMASRLNTSGLSEWFTSSSAVDSATFIGAGTSFSVFRQRVHEIPLAIQGDLEGLQISLTRPKEKSPSFVAYKTIKAKLKADGEPRDEDRLALLSALQEILALTHRPLLEHPYILDFRGLAWSSGAGLETWLPTIIVEYAARGTLKCFLSQDKVNIDLKRSLCVHVGLALQALHKCGIVHGDVKPENILVVEKDSELVAKLADFGFTTLGNEWPSFLSGTFLWSAPETTASRVRYPKKADVFSYGLLVWSVALDGKSPYQVLADLQGIRTLSPFVSDLKTSRKTIQAALEWITSNAVPPSWIQKQQSAAITNSKKKLNSNIINSLEALLCSYKIGFHVESLTNVCLACLQQDPSQRSLEKAIEDLDSMGERASINIGFSPLATSRLYQSCLDNISSDRLEKDLISEATFKAQQAMAMNVPNSSHIKPTTVFTLCAARINGIGIDKDHEIALNYLSQALRVRYNPAKALIYRFHKTLGVDLPNDYDPFPHLEESIHMGSLAATTELKELAPDRFRKALECSRDRRAGVGANFFEMSQMKVEWLTDSEISGSDLQSTIVSQGETSAEVKDFRKIQVNKRGDELTHYAASCGLTDVISWLLIVNLDLLNRTNEQSETPLLCACRSGQNSLVKLLLNHRLIDSSIGTLNSDTPLHWMINIDNEDLPEILQGIVDHGTDVNAVCSEPIEYVTSKMGMRLAYTEQYCAGTPLHWAVCRNNVRLVKRLL